MARPQVILEKDTRDCVNTANQGDYSNFFPGVRQAALNMQQTLYGCAEIASVHRKELLKRATIGLDDRLRFALNVAENLEIPAGTFGGVSRSDPDDYLEARMSLLIQLDKGGGPRSVHTFYPEILAETASVRERMAKIAIYHAGLKEGFQKQVVFFSLCGWFSWDQAERTTTYHTTCALFARACMVAAGFRRKSGDWGNNASGKGVFQLVNIGSDAVPPYVQYGRRNARMPQQGDIFHVNMPGTYRDHMGVITSSSGMAASADDDDDSWSCWSVQGGSANGTTTTSTAVRFMLSSSLARAAASRVAAAFGIASGG
jgi:hypothetical protein